MSKSVSQRCAILHNLASLCTYRFQCCVKYYRVSRSVSQCCTILHNLSDVLYRAIYHKQMSRITSDMQGYHCSSSRSTKRKHVLIKLQYKDFLYLNINQLDALNFIMSLFHASTCFEHMCSKHVEA